MSGDMGKIETFMYYFSNQLENKIMKKRDTRMDYYETWELKKFLEKKQLGKKQLGKKQLGKKQLGKKQLEQFTKVQIEREILHRDCENQLRSRKSEIVKWYDLTQ